MGSIQPEPRNSQAADSIVEASIADLTAALESRRTTAVDLATCYLLRIATFDTRNTCLNSVPIINPNVLDEAAASDERRASGRPSRPLEGIPFTVKDSYKVKGMTVASGSEAFESLIANEDAFTVKALRDAGAILIGKTNMCPMAFGGMLRGVYGRAESPYNPKYLAAAFASGSSNGSGVSTGASFAAFGMGEETVSSGRSPASNNGLVAYTPSRGLISIRGNWPLYPTCDVVVPHTRTMGDLFAILDTLTAEDDRSVGDFWRDQPFVDLRKDMRRPSSNGLRQTHCLRGKKIAVPAMYVGEPCTGTAVYTSDSTLELWQRAKTDLEELGAIVEIVKDFPVMRLYEDPSSEWPENYPQEGRLPPDWNTTERGTLIAHAWDDFLRGNEDSAYPTLSSVEWRKIFPQMPVDDPQLMFSEVANAVHWSKLASYAENNKTCNEPGRSEMYKTANLERAVKALETMRKVLFEDWMTQNGFDLVAFPAAGDVGFAESDIDVELARHTWRNGVKYSNGNRCLRHLGIPSITVPMGMLRDRQMPMGLTFLARAYEDTELLQTGYVFEQSRQRRIAPPLTPALATDKIREGVLDLTAGAPQLRVTRCEISETSQKQLTVAVRGTVELSSDSSDKHADPVIELYVDGTRIPAASLVISPVEGSSESVSFSADVAVSAPKAQDQRNSVVGKIARDGSMVLILARNTPTSRPSGYMKLIHSW